MFVWKKYETLEFWLDVCFRLVDLVHLGESGLLKINGDDWWWIADILISLKCVCKIHENDGTSRRDSVFLDLE